MHKKLKNENADFDKYIPRKAGVNNQKVKHAATNPKTTIRQYSISLNFQSRFLVFFSNDFRTPGHLRYLI